MGKKLDAAIATFETQLREAVEMETYMRFNVTFANALRGIDIPQSDSAERVEFYTTKVHTYWDVLRVCGWDEARIVDIIHEVRNAEWQRCHDVVRERERDSV